MIHGLRRLSLIYVLPAYHRSNFFFGFVILRLAAMIAQRACQAQKQSVILLRSKKSLLHDLFPLSSTYHACNVDLVGVRELAFSEAPRLKGLYTSHKKKRHHKNENEGGVLLPFRGSTYFFLRLS